MSELDTIPHLTLGFLGRLPVTVPTVAGTDDLGHAYDTTTVLLGQGGGGSHSLVPFPFTTVVRSYLSSCATLERDWVAAGEGEDLMEKTPEVFDGSKYSIGAMPWSWDASEWKSFLKVTRTWGMNPYRGWWTDEVILEEWTSLSLGEAVVRAHLAGILSWEGTPLQALDLNPWQEFSLLMPVGNVLQVPAGTEDAWA